MNIALVIFRAEIERGGAERYVHQLSTALAARGHTLTILTSRPGTHEHAEFVRIAAGGTTRVMKYKRFCRNLERHLASHSYDVVHACLPVPRCDIYQAHSGLETLSLRDGHLRHAGLPRQVIAKLLGRFNRKRNAFARVERALITSARPPITICLSNRERDQAILAFPSARDRFITLYSFPDDDRFPLTDLTALRKRMRKELGMSDAQTLFLFIGNDFERKGLATAIRALGRMSDPQAVLLVAGEGDTHYYTGLALRAGAMGRVMFVGQVDEVRNYLAAADAVVLPTRSEPFGMVVVEAMLMGVPPVVSRVAGASEVVTDGKNGFVIDDPKDVQAWADAMTRLTDRAYRDALAVDCIEQRHRFSFAQHVDVLESLYQKSRNIA